MIKERLISAVIGTLFIAIFQPFGIIHFGWWRWPLLIGIGILIAFSCLTSELITNKLFRLPNDISRGSRYIMRRNFIFEATNVPLLTTLLCVYLHYLVNNEHINNHFGWSTLGSVLLVNAYTTMIIHLYWRNVYKKRIFAMQLEEAQRLNGILAERFRQEQMRHNSHEGGADNSTPTTPLCIEGSTKEKVTVEPHNFLFAESEGNYVNVHYLKSNEVKTTMLRSTIKDVADAVCSCSNILRCHRAFIANMQQVHHLEGRSSGFMLVMNHQAGMVPVSKTYQQSVKTQLECPS